MQSSDNEFFEEYKHLEKICSEIYSCREGIKQYITDMEENSSNGQFRVPGWNSDYQKLKYIRWVRNKIAHESSVCQFSSDEDLAYVKNLYDRIISGEDPLTLLRKSEKPHQRTVTAKPLIQVEDITFSEDLTKKPSILPIMLIAGLVILTLIAVIMLINN